MNSNKITTVINEPPTLLTLGTNFPPLNTRINVANVVNENNTAINMKNYNKEQRRLIEKNYKKKLNNNMNNFKLFGIVNNNMDSNLNNNMDSNLNNNNINNSLTNNDLSINNGEYNNNAINNTEYTNSKEPLKQKYNVNPKNTRKLTFKNVTNVRTYGINNFNKTTHKGPKESTSTSWRSKIRRNPSLTIRPSYRSKYNADLSYLAAKVAEKHNTQKEMLDAVKNNKHVKKYYQDAIENEINIRTANDDEINTRSALTNKELLLADKIKKNIIQGVSKKLGRVLTTRNGHRIPVYNNLNLNRPNNNMKTRKQKTRKQKTRKEKTRKRKNRKN